MMYNLSIFQLSSTVPPNDLSCISLFHEKLQKYKLGFRHLAYLSILDERQIDATPLVSYLSWQKYPINTSPHGGGMPPPRHPPNKSLPFMRYYEIFFYYAVVYRMVLITFRKRRHRKNIRVMNRLVFDRWTDGDGATIQARVNHALGLTFGSFPNQGMMNSGLNLRYTTFCVNQSNVKIIPLGGPSVPQQ